MKSKALWIVGLMSSIMLAMPLAAALTTAPSGEGHTHVTNSACTPTVAAPLDQTVTLGSSPDTVRVPMNIEWFDERTAPAVEIIHRFQMDTTYGANPYSAYVEKRTTGGMSQSQTDSFYMDVPGVTRNTNMFVLYSVSVRYSSSGTTLCSTDNSAQWPPISFEFV